MKRPRIESAPGATATLVPVTTITDDIEASIVALVRQGTLPADAALELGVSRATFARWRAASRRPSERRPNVDFDPRAELFFVRVDAANARCVGRAIRRLSELALDGDDLYEPQVRALEAFLAVRRAREREPQEDARARAQSARDRTQHEKLRLEVANLAKFGRTAANIRRDAEEHTATTILDVIRATVDDATYEGIVSALAGVASRADESEGEASPVVH